MSTLPPDIEQGFPPQSTTAYGGDHPDEDTLRCSDEEACSTSTVHVDEGASRPSCSSCLSECDGGDTTVEVAVAVEEVVGITKGGVHLSKVERECRICHMSVDGSNSDSGFPIELGCSCKDDLAVAHKHCAEAWFKIRGNKTCEICGSTARNIVGVNEVEQLEQWNEANNAITTIAQPHPVESRHFWQGHRFLNFLLACMVFAFVISWLFHFNVPS